MNMQADIWEKEYRQPKLVTGSNEPQTSVKDFLRWVRRDMARPLENLNVLDLGCGNGKNALYIADLDPTNSVIGVDVSETALAAARDATKELAKSATTPAIDKQTIFLKQSIGEPLRPLSTFPDNGFDIILDVTSSNSLNEAERSIYLHEVHRVLKPKGFFFVRALCKDGDTNAQNLLKMNPGPEKDTYILPDVGLTERVFSREDFIQTYSPASTSPTDHPLFNIISLEKETHYTKFSGRSYKRNFWVAYLEKK